MRRERQSCPHRHRSVNSVLGCRSSRHACRDAARVIRPRDARARPSCSLGAAGSLGSALLERLLGRARVAGPSWWRPGIAQRRHPGPAGSASRRLAAASRVHADAPCSSTTGRASQRPRRRLLVPPARRISCRVARWLRDCGVGALAVVMPHAPSTLPEALKQGLANLDEEAVTIARLRAPVVRALGAAPAQRRAGSRLAAPGADGCFRSCTSMVPQREQPVRPRQGGRVRRQALAHLPRARPGTWRREAGAGVAGLAPRPWTSWWCAGSSCSPDRGHPQRSGSRGTLRQAA